MSSRLIASRSLQALRPSVRIGIQALPSCTRFLSTTPEEPKAKAASIIDAIPGSNLISKTGILATSTAAAVYAISNELYVVNEESILLVCFGLLSYGIAKLVAPGITEAGDAKVNEISSILNSSRTKHVAAVQDRINSVSQLKDVTKTTSVLFEISKETAHLEAEAFELKQKVDIAAEAKAVLDSWVRYEASVRQREQKQLAEAIIAKVNKEVVNPDFQQKLLRQSVDNIEKIFSKAK